MMLEAMASALKNMESMGERFDPFESVLDQPLDPTSGSGKRVLAGTQGNILQAHGQDHALHLWITFGAAENEAEHDRLVARTRDWIRFMSEECVTSAETQFEDRERAKEQGVWSVLTVTNLLLSSHGYEFLGEPRPRDGAFRDGMRARGHLLDDPTVASWEEAYQVDDEEVHALVIVGAKDEATLEGEHRRIVDSLESNGGSVLIEERGKQKRDPASNRPVEHFGYADGVSQPRLIEKGGIAAENYDQHVPLSLVLSEDRHGGGYGSFLVYRKLEQDVESFRAAVERVASELGEDEELVGAMAIGRFKNGTPLTSHGAPKPDYDRRSDEDFDYSEDPDGAKCPFHAHVRKVNPRGSMGFMRNMLAREQSRRIARRGITYESPEDGSVGLLFMCFQSDIRDQFETLQRFWANSSNFPELGAGLDPVIGQDRGEQEENDFPNWSSGYASTERERIGFGEHVRLCGGEYFFAPSLAGLRALGQSR